MRTKHKATKLIDPAGSWHRNVQIAELGDLAPHIGGRPAEIAATWFYFWQMRKWFSKENRKKIKAAQWQEFLEYEQAEEANFQCEATLALFHGDHRFFSDLAEAIKHFATTQGAPIDPVRLALLCHHAGKGISNAEARRTAEKAGGRRYDNAEVRRILVEIGFRTKTTAPAATKRQQPLAPPTPTGKPPRERKPAVATPTKAKQAHRRESSAQAQLLVLGVPRRLVYSGGLFWRRTDLVEVLEDAALRRRDLVRREHADKTGDETLLRQINRAWEQIESEFAAHGFRLNP